MTDNLKSEEELKTIDQIWESVGPVQAYTERRVWGQWVTEKYDNNDHPCDGPILYLVFCLGVVALFWWII